MRAVKQSRALATRQRILAEAGRLFGLKGYDGTKLEEVLKGSRTSMGAFFHHFESKEDLGFAVLDHGREERLRVLDREEALLRPTSGADPLAKVFNRLDAYRAMAGITQGKQGGCVFGNLSTSLSDTHEDFRRRLATSFDEMASEFQAPLDEAASKLGSTDRVDTAVLARYIVSVIQGSIMLARVHRDPLILKRHYDCLKDHLRQTLGA